MEEVKVLIIGSGPAGYSAATYASRAQLEPVQLAGFKSGGQLMYTTEVENYAGFEEGVRGPQLMMTMRKQAERFGTKIIDQYATAVDLSERPFKVWTNIPENTNPEIFETGSPKELAKLREQIIQAEPAYSAQALIITTGASAVMLKIPGEQELLGRGVSTCAVCDAAFYKDKIVYVVGGGDSAMEDTMALIKFAKEVYVIHRRDSFKASKIMQDRVLNNPKVKVLWNTEVLEVMGDQAVEKIKVRTTTDGKSEEKELEAQGFFLAIGHRPVTQIFQNQLKLDERGFMVTRQSWNQHGLELAAAAKDENGLVKYPSMTSVEGVFAGGDNVDFHYKQAITAAGQGCQAALDAEWWLEREQG